MEIGDPVREIEAPAPLDVPTVPEPAPVEEPAVVPEREREKVPA